MRDIVHAFSPNKVLSTKTMWVIASMQVVAFFILWFCFAPTIIPKPQDLIPAFRDLVHEGLLHSVLVSLITLIEALAITAGITFVLAISTAVPFMRPGVRFATTLRFVSFVGFTFLFTILTGGGHALKIAMLVFGMGTYMLTSKKSLIDDIPQSEYDHARTLGMSEWRVTIEVMIFGRMDHFIDAIRQNAAIGWMLVPVVEGLVRSEGGIGTTLLNESKHFNLAEVFALQMTIFAIALVQDYLFGVAKNVLCPYAKLEVGGAK